MALTNAERQARWRDKRNELACIIETERGTDIVEALLKEWGVEKARTVERVLHKRLRAIKADCKACHGTGLMPVAFTPDGIAKPAATGDEVRMTSPCDCGPKAADFTAPPQEFSWKVIATTKDRKRWENGVRLRTREEAKQYCEIHVQQDYGPEGKEGYVTKTSIIRTDDRPRNSIFKERGRPTLGFTHGDCHLLSWHEVGTPAPTECKL
jgi:hypothetical protein